MFYINAKPCWIPGGGGYQKYFSHILTNLGSSRSSEIYEIFCKQKIFVLNICEFNKCFYWIRVTVFSPLLNNNANLTPAVFCWEFLISIKTGGGGGGGGYFYQNNLKKDSFSQPNEAFYKNFWKFMDTWFFFVIMRAFPIVENVLFWRLVCFHIVFCLDQMTFVTKTNIFCFFSHPKRSNSSTCPNPCPIYICGCPSWTIWETKKLFNCIN